MCFGLFLVLRRVEMWNVVVFCDEKDWGACMDCIERGSRRSRLEEGEHVLNGEGRKRAWISAMPDNCHVTRLLF